MAKKEINYKLLSEVIYVNETIGVCKISWNNGPEKIAIRKFKDGVPWGGIDIELDDVDGLVKALHDMGVSAHSDTSKAKSVEVAGFNLFDLLDINHDIVEKVKGRIFKDEDSNKSYMMMQTVNKHTENEHKTVSRVKYERFYFDDKGRLIIPISEAKARKILSGK